MTCNSGETVLFPRNESRERRGLRKFRWKWAGHGGHLAVGTSFFNESDDPPRRKRSFFFAWKIWSRARRCCRKKKQTANFWVYFGVGGGAGGARDTPIGWRTKSWRLCQKWLCLKIGNLLRFMFYDLLVTGLMISFIEWWLLLAFAVFRKSTFFTR